MVERREVWKMSSEGKMGGAGGTMIEKFIINAI